MLIVLAAGSGPQVVVSGWWTWLLVGGAAATAIVAIVTFLTKVMLPLMDAVSEIRRDYPVWTEIADRFGDEGRETISMELRALASNQEVSVVNQQTLMAQQQAQMAQLQTVIETTARTDEKLSETRHKIIGEFQTLRTLEFGAETIVDVLVKTHQELMALREALADVSVDKPTSSPAETSDS